MGDHGDYEPVFESLITALASLDPLPMEYFAYRLHNKAKLHPFLLGLERYVSGNPNYPPDPPSDSDTLINGYAAWKELTALAIASMGDAIIGVSDSKDKEGLKSNISKTNAESRYLDVMTSLLGFCLGEHINNKMQEMGLRSLRTLADLPGFLEYYKDMIQSERFIRNRVRIDGLKGNHLFSICLLFIVDNLRDPDLSIPGLDPNFQRTLACETLNIWSHTIWAHRAEDNPELSTEDVLTFCGRHATLGLCPPTESGLLQPTPTFNVLKEFYENVADSTVFDDAEYTSAVQSGLSRIDDSEDIINEWQSYCQVLSSTYVANAKGYWQSGADAAFSAMDWNTVKGWMANCYGWERDTGLYFTRPDITVITNDPLTARGSGAVFLPGTHIQLPNGTSCPIEQLKAGDHVLTTKNPPISVALEKPPIRRQCHARWIAFNGGKPFTTTSQVFSTTTGLRAVDPDEAQTQNPFQKVEPLAVGHLLYYMQGDRCTTFEIKSIEESNDPTMQTAYSVPLNEAHPTHYAGGYQVALNRPEHTLGAVAEALRAVPGSKRLSLLAMIEEAQALLLKYDARVIHSRLNWELFGQYESPDGEQPPATHKTQNISPGDLRKVVIQRSKSRAGRGVPLHSGRVRTFSLSHCRESYVPAGYVLPALAIVDGYLVVNDEVQLKSTYESQRRVFRWTRELPQQKLFEHGAVRVDSRGTGGNGVIYLSNDSESTQTQNGDQIYPFRARLGRWTYDGDSDDDDDDDGTFEIGRWNVQYDRSVWEEDTEKTQPDDPIDGGQLVDVQAPYNVIQVQIPVLDQLQTQINSKFRQNLGNFYTTSCYIDKSGREKVCIRLDKSALMPFISDSGMDVETLEVSFKDAIGVDLTLPVLFQEMTLSYNPLYTKLTGAWYEYDPTKRGMKGNRHLVVGTPGDDAKSSYEARLRSKVSHAYATDLNPAERLPARVTEDLLRDIEPDIDALVEFSVYDEKDVHNTSQSLIHDMMLFHMNPDDRDQFMDVSKPDLPSELGSSLPQNLKDFFRNKYGPAFICRSIGRTAKYVSSFTEKEKRQLWYWWEGNSKNSLAQSQEYNDLNGIASRAAMHQLYDKAFLNTYIDSSQGAEGWANDLFKAISSKRVIRAYAAHPIADNGNNLVNKQCCLLDALDTSKSFADCWFKEFVGYVASDPTLNYPYIDEDKDLAGQWIADAMEQLILQVLDNNSQINQQVREALQEQINEFEKANNLDQTKTIEERTAAIMVVSGTLMTQMGNWISAIGMGLSTAFGGTKLFQWVSEGFEQAAKKAAFQIFQAAYTLFGLVNDWSILSTSQRITVILQTLQMVVNGISNAMDAWKQFMSGNSQSADTAIALTKLNESVGDSITKNIEELADTVDEIYGEEGAAWEKLSDRITGNGIPSSQETVVEDEIWDESLDKPAADVPPGGEEQADKFSISGKALRVLNVILGIGLVIAMTFSLARDWDNLSTPGKIINTLTVVTQALTVLIDVFETGVELGFWVTTEVLSAALSVVGAVLAVVGVVLMFISLLMNLFMGDPPEDPIEKYIENTGKPLIDSFDSAPDPKLTYTLSPQQILSKHLTSIRVTATNNSADQVSFPFLTITLLGGGDLACLFKHDIDAVIELVSDTDGSKDHEGHTYVTPASTVGATLPTPSKIGTKSIYYQYDLRVAGPKNEGENSLSALVLDPGQSFSSVWTGYINDRGNDNDSSWSYIDIVESTTLDKTNKQISILRM
ncbi:hypothetical protein L228DRAFT_268931 [Xylona heveae TC161]|uniref:Uncharacterized protein n=1 Tax=Xylona heveae (strain CBS 132557 / TC161) TaxID=1328760 RepID=A0A165GQD5_XYLHT|nr:hypothetical protein L228DRAFT_268931 [Xylona heveae TC161]KZF22467.1 hypothetical protein L228DRAFT_268931 [Xylona heveae TC161]